FEVHYSSEPYSEDTLNWWLPIDEASDVTEIEAIGAKVSYCMAADIAGSFTFDYLANFDTNEFILTGNISYGTSGTAVNDLGSFSVSGIIEGTLFVNTPEATVSHYGAIDFVNIYAVDETSYHEYGFVKVSLELQKGRLVIENTGNATTVVLPVSTNGTAENKGYIGTLNSTEESEPVQLNNSGFVNSLGDNGVINNTTSTQKTTGAPTGFSILIGDLNQLEAFRDAVNFGMTCENLSIKLTSDINLGATAWTPIGWASRKLKDDPTVFKGTFDGNNHTISGLSTSGFTPTAKGIREDNYLGATEKNYVFGLFGVAHNAEFRNVKFTNVNIHELGNGYLLDGAAALLGFSVGSLTVKNITASGVISGQDGIGGIIGRVYKTEKRNVDWGSDDAIILIEDCINNVNVTITQKGGGVVGYIQDKTYENTPYAVFKNCINNGNIKSSTSVAGAIFSTTSNIVADRIPTLLQGCVNNGQITDRHGTSVKLYEYSGRPL
ncbi:MAG: hypothetical protein PHX04_06320, partial [Bacilli bacterium]|nr:hypothetical protein [Bacilli bacterium]